MTEQEKKQMKSISGIANELKSLIRELREASGQKPAKLVTIDEVLDAGGESLKDVVGGAFAIVVQKSGVVDYGSEPYNEICHGFINRRWGCPKRASDFDDDLDYDSMYQKICMAIGLAVGDKLYRAIRVEKECDLSDEELKIVNILQKTKHTREEAATAIAKKRRCSITAAKEVLSRYKFLVFEDEMSENDLKSALDTIMDDDKIDTSKITPFDLFNV